MTKTLTAAQTKTLNYIRENGPIDLTSTSRGGYSTRSAAEMVRMGVLVEVMVNGWRHADLPPKPEPFCSDIFPV